MAYSMVEAGQSVKDLQDMDIDFFFDLLAAGQDDKKGNDETDLEDIWKSI